MAIELKQSLKLSQQLVITPQLQQAIKLLQLSRIELSEMVQNELLENPILEEAPKPEDTELPSEMAKEVEAPQILDKSHETQAEVGTKDGEMVEPKDFDWENYVDNYSSSGESSANYASNAEEGPTYDNFISKPTSLADHLEWQLHMAELTDEEIEIGLALIGSLDDNGYLTQSIETILEKNSFDQESLEYVLGVIQDFDPIGVAAKDLKECLLIQIRHHRLKDRHLLEAIISEHLNLLERRDFGSLSKKLKIPVEKVAELVQIISELEPKPGRAFGGTDTHYIVPDVYVHKVGEKYAVVLNEEGLPRLQVSNFYKNMIKSNGVLNGKSKDKEAKGYVQDKLKSALWLIKSIHQRQRTLYRVSKCIVKFQKDFLDHGINKLKPMILKDVAEEIGVHESTVSRATTSKYMHTPQGIYELKFFFNSGVSNSSGNDVASETVKEKIRNLVASENVKKPYSDKDLVEMLSKHNINIARRTVAKYREMLGILPSSKRRQLY